MSDKIAYLLGSLNRGGTETLLLDVLRNGAKHHLDAMAVYRKTGALEDDFLTCGVAVYKLSFKKNIFAYLLRLRKLLVSNKIKVAHAQQPIDALYAWLACVGTAIKVVHTFHGYDFTENRIGGLILGFIIKRTDINIYVSDTQRKYYQEKYGLKAVKQKVLYNGISFEKLDVGLTSTLATDSMTLSHTISNAKITRGATSSRTPSTKSLRTALQLSSDTLLLGAVGNFNDVRDQITTCRFLNKLNEQKVDFHFVFVGKQIESTPELYNDCVSFCQDNGLSKFVSFLGSRNDVPQILNELDAFIYSTDHDTFGIAVVEAMAVGLPVFVNDWGVMNEITDGGRWATVYKTKDEVDLLEKFLIFTKNRIEYTKRSKEIKSLIRAKFSIEVHIEMLKKSYVDLLNGKR